MTTATQQMQLGDRVIFHDHSGLPKAAMVTGTYQSIDSRRAQQDGQVPDIKSETHLHLGVFPPTGGYEVRYNIEQGNGPGQWEPRNGGSG